MNTTSEPTLPEDDADGSSVDPAADLGAGVADTDGVTPRASRWLPLLLVVIGFAVYWNSLDGVFLLDDNSHILHNARIRQLSPPDHLLSGRRPVLDATLALNFAVSELEPWSYHAFNMVVHVLASLVLLGLVRRVLLCEGLRPRFADSSSWLAFTVAVIWLVHPLQTQSVTYIVQRSESLMGLFCLLTLYCTVRGAESPRRSGWWSLPAVVFCAMGMGCKGVMVTAPFLVLLFDHALFARSLKCALRQRRGLYVGLALTWGVLWMSGVASGVLDPSNEGANVGFGFKGISPVAYALTQLGVIVYYLRLSFWPFPLCLDYGWPIAGDAASVVAAGAIVTAALVALILAIRRRPEVAAVGVSFFLLLAPTSSVVPISDPAFEHRMYLPLAAVLSLIVIGGVSLARQIACRLCFSGVARRGCFLALLLTVAGTLGLGVVRRNNVYHSELGMWEDVLTKRPGNARAHDSLGTALFAIGRIEKSVELFRSATQLDGNNGSAAFNLGTALTVLEDWTGAETAFRKVIALKPRHAAAHLGLGNALSALDKHDEAVTEFREASRLQPDLMAARLNLANALSLHDREVEAAGEFRTLLEQWPDYATGHYNLAGVLWRQGLSNDAIAEYRETLRCDPFHLSALQKLGGIYFSQRRMPEAAEVFAAGIEVHPDNATLHRNLGAALATLERYDEAIAAFETARRIEPDDAAIHYNLGTALARVGRFEAAAEAFQTSLTHRSDDIPTLMNFGRALTELGRFDEAVEQFQVVLTIDPYHRMAERAIQEATAAKDRMPGS